MAATQSAERYLKKISRKKESITNFQVIFVPCSGLKYPGILIKRLILSWRHLFHDFPVILGKGIPDADILWMKNFTGLTHRINDFVIGDKGCECRENATPRSTVPENDQKSSQRIQRWYLEARWKCQVFS